MRTSHHVIVLATAALSATTAVAQIPAPAQQPTAPMTFFITSVGKGDGANLGGLAGADAHCLSLAEAAGDANLLAQRNPLQYLGFFASDD